MFNIVYNLTAILMLIWYGCLRWTFLPSNVLNTVETSKGWVTTLGWPYAPINLFTAFTSFIFLIPALIIPEVTYNKFWLCVAAFLWLRNIYYTLEDSIDLYKYPSKIQFSYVIIDLLMVVVTSLWFFKYYGFLK